MAFTEEEINEFKIEAADLLDQAEKSLLSLETGGIFKEHYDAIFRAFHSIKGAAGMMEMTDLQKHMHLLENTLTEQKNKDVLAKEHIDLFLRGADACRQLLEGQAIQFDYSAGAAPVVQPKPVEPVKPVVVDFRPPAAGATVAGPIATGEHHGKVVVVDDEPEIVMILESILMGAGFEVKSTTKPEEALDLIKEFKPNAVLTDISMPKLNGLQLLQKITQYDPDIPVTVISGNVTKEFLVEAVKMGVFGVVEKPFNVGRVIECSHQAVNRHVLSRLVSEGINLLMYQFSDLDQYLKVQGKEDVRKVISFEIKNLIEQRRKMRESRKLTA